MDKTPELAKAILASNGNVTVRYDSFQNAFGIILSNGKLLALQDGTTGYSQDEIFKTKNLFDSSLALHGFKAAAAAMSFRDTAKTALQNCTTSVTFNPFEEKPTYSIGRPLKFSRATGSISRCL